MSVLLSYGILTFFNCPISVGNCWIKLWVKTNFSKFRQKPRLSGRDLSLFSSASKTLSLSNFPIDCGIEVNRLFEIFNCSRFSSSPIVSGIWTIWLDDKSSSLTAVHFSISFFGFWFQFRFQKCRFLDFDFEFNNADLWYMVYGVISSR